MPSAALLKFSIIPILLLAGGTGGFLVLASMKVPPPAAEMPDLRPLVATLPLEESDSGFSIAVDGSVVPLREVALTAEVAGQIVEKSPACEAGNYVQAGTLLLKIDSRRYELEAKRLQSLVDQGESELAQIEIEQRNNDELIALAERDQQIREAELQRVSRLYQSGTLSEGERDRIEAEVIAARTALQQLRNSQSLLPSRETRARAELELRQAQLAMANLDIEHTVIRAPISGMITADPVEQDQYIAPGAELVRIEDTSAVEIRCNLRVEDLYWLWNSSGESPGTDTASGNSYYEIPPTSATVTYRLGNREYEWDARLVRYEGVGLDETTRTVPCRLLVPEPRRAGATEGPPALVRGMFVTVHLHVNPQAKLLRVPTASLQPNGEIWTLEGDKLRVHPVQVAKSMPQWTLIAADETELAPGSQLIVTPVSPVFDGMEVRVKESTTPSGT